MAVYIRPRLGGPFFTGVYLPQKSVLSPPIESQYKPFQKHVSSYILKRSPDSVVWTLRTVTCALPYFIIEDNSLRGENTVADSNPARVKARSGEIHPIYHNFKLIAVR
jgi:hypothetical protein